METKRIHLIIITWFVLQHIEALDFLPIPRLALINEAILLFICLLYTFKYLLKNGVRGITIPILFYAFIYPIYGGIRANIVFDQPIFMGILSLRYEVYILFIFYLFLSKVNYSTVIRIINRVNIIVALLSIVAFYVFNQTTVSVMSWVHSSKAIDVGLNESAFAVKGEFLTVCSNLMIVSLIFYLDRLFHHHTWKDVVFFVVLLFYLLFVHKGRNPVFILAGIYCLEVVRLKDLPKKLILIPVSLIIVTFILSQKPEFLQRFSEIFLFENTNDSSASARFISISEALVFVQNNLLLGIGNLSAHFGYEGFHTFFPDTFYVTDIGILGSLMMGGIVIILVYFVIFIFLVKNFKLYRGNLKSFLYFMVAFYLIRILVLGDPLILQNCFSFALLYYPLLNPAFSVNEK